AWFLLVIYLIVGATVHVLDAFGPGGMPTFTAAMKVVLAFVAWVWVIVLIPLVPKLLEARSDEEFSELLSQHEEAKQALQEKEAVYKSLIESLPLNVFRKDLKGRFVDGNQRFCDTIGKPLGQIVGKSDADFFPAEQVQKYRRDDTRVMEKGEALEDIVAYIKQTGEKLHLHVVKAP